MALGPHRDHLTDLRPVDPVHGFRGPHAAAPLGEEVLPLRAFIVIHVVEVTGSYDICVVAAVAAIFGPDTGDGGII